VLGSAPAGSVSATGGPARGEGADRAEVARAGVPGPHPPGAGAVRARHRGRRPRPNLVERLHHPAMLRARFHDVATAHSRVVEDAGPRGRGPAFGRRAGGWGRGECGSSRRSWQASRSLDFPGRGMIPVAVWSRHYCSCGIFHPISERRTENTLGILEIRMILQLQHFSLDWATSPIMVGGESRSMKRGRYPEPIGAEGG
jgi:hypothetical protein